MQQTVFTIGHSTHLQEKFLALLSMHGITALCDVRSKPYSRVNPQFNRDELKEVLLDQGIRYLFLGKELGARSDDPACYENGKVQYDRLAKTELFQQGLKRLQDGTNKGFRIALMCAEKEPLECHRTILVARHLANLGIDVQHIHADGRLESHADALRRLSRIVGLQSDMDDMFNSPEALQAEAYRLQEDRIAYELERAPALEAPTFRSASG
jgi:uncharacterized protein (DUF488 family)